MTDPPVKHDFQNQLNIFIMKCFQTIVFIFIVISTTFRPICPPAFFRCLSNSGTFMELRTTSIIESTGVISSDSISHIGQNVVKITIKMKTIARKPLMVKITKLRLRNLDNQLNILQKSALLELERFPSDN